MAYGSVKHNPSKVASRRKSGMGMRKLSVDVRVHRTEVPKGQFNAMACPRAKRRTDPFARERCGSGRGASPTIAVKRALADMARKLK